MSYQELAIPEPQSAPALQTRLREIEESTPREIVDLGCATFSTPENGENFALWRRNDDSDLLPELLVKKVPLSARRTSDAFFEFLADFISDHQLLAHQNLVFNGQIVPVILLRPVSAGAVHVLRGDGSWGWEAVVDGDDLVVTGAKTTAFGGGDDDHDTGQTASGFPTKGNPNLLGAALPFAYTGSKPRLIEALGGSPIPLMPYGIHSDGSPNPNGAHVLVSDPNSGRSIEVPVIDRGPAKNVADPRPLDLTVAAARFFDPSATANVFSKILDFRILNGAKLAGVTPIAGIRDGFAKELVRLALVEFNRYSRVKEYESPLSSQIRRYWTDLGFNFESTSVPWSAVFISWLVKKAGATSSEFKFSAAHSGFVYHAIKENGLPRPAFIGRPVADYVPKIGDIIHNNRGGRSYDFEYAASHWQYKSHSAIVVELGSDRLGRYALTVGGNESDSVRKNRVALNANGTIRQLNYNPYIAVLENVKS